KVACSDVGIGSLNCGQIQDRRLQMWITFAGSFAEMTGGSAEVDQVLKAAKVEGCNDPGRAEAAEAVHALQEFAHGVVGSEEGGKNWAVETEGLLPTRRSFTDGV